MSKAEEQALKAYPRTDDSWGDEWQKRVGFVEGYKQAEKDLIEKNAVEGEVIDKGDFIKFADGKYIDLNPTMGAEPFVKLEEGNKVKVIIIKE